jgi:hypothetical protein
MVATRTEAAAITMTSWAEEDSALCAVADGTLDGDTLNEVDWDCYVVGEGDAMGESEPVAVLEGAVDGVG